MTAPNSRLFLPPTRMLVSLTAVCAVLGTTASLAHADGDAGSDNILVRGAQLLGSTNGMFFDAHDRLYVANVLGQSISIIDPDSGELLGKLTPEQGVFFADDVTVAPDGSIYWTDFVLGLVNGLSPDGQPISVAAGIANANPLTVSPDGRLFFAQCFSQTANAIYEGDPTGANPPRVILQDGPGCASNGMDYLDGGLFSPRWFEDRVVRVDVETGEISEVTGGWPTPAAVKFDSKGRLHGVSQFGEVVRIDRATGARRLLATLPFGLDNLAFDSHDRLFVSSNADAFVVEVREDGSVRTVSAGGLSTPAGIGIIGNKLFVGEIQSLRTFSTKSGRELDVLRSIFAVGPLPILPFAASPLDRRRLVLADWFDGQMAIWNTKNESVEALGAFAAPVDAVPFMGGIAVTELGLGQVTLTSKDLTGRVTLGSGLVVPAGLAAWRNRDLYVSDSALGQVFQVVRRGEVLAQPEPVTDEPFLVPEGIVMRGRHRLVVVETGTGSLKEINLRNGRVRTLADGLAFRPAVAVPVLPPFGFLNHVEIDRKGNLYVNGDGAGVIYKFDRRDLRRRKKRKEYYDW